MPKSSQIAALQSGLNFKLVKNKPVIALITSRLGAVFAHFGRRETMGISCAPYPRCLNFDYVSGRESNMALYRRMREAREGATYGQTNPYRYFGSWLFNARNRARQSRTTPKTRSTVSSSGRLAPGSGSRLEPPSLIWEQSGALNLTDQPVTPGYFKFGGIDSLSRAGWEMRCPCLEYGPRAATGIDGSGPHSEGGGGTKPARRQSGTTCSAAGRPPGGPDIGGQLPGRADIGEQESRQRAGARPLSLQEARLRRQRPWRRRKRCVGHRAYL